MSHLYCWKTNSINKTLHFQWLIIKQLIQLVEIKSILGQ